MAFLFECSYCHQAQSSPLGMLRVEDTRGGTLSNPTSNVWRFCSFDHLRRWSASYVDEPAEPGPGGRRLSGVQSLSGGQHDE